MRENTAYIFCVGKELLEGLVLDRNANFMAGKLSEAGYGVRGIQVLDDDEEAMVDAFRHVLKRKPAVVFTTGGMGPGHDDITRESVAKAVGVPLQRNEQAVEMVERSYRRLFAKGIVEDPQLNEDRLKMAIVPHGAVCFENPIGTAPAVQLKVRDTVFFLLPGAPTEMQRMFGLYVLPALAGDGPGTHKKAHHVDYPGRDESALSRVLSDLTRRHPDVHTKARLRDDDPKVGIRITIFGEHTDEVELERLLSRAEADLRARLGLEVHRWRAGEDSGPE